MIGKQVAHYKIIEKLGGGGMGVVYKASDTKLDRYVALKFLPHHLSHDEIEKQRFVREAKAASALDHPNICTIHEIGEADDGQSYIAMAYYEGETLKKKIKEKRLKIEEIIDITRQIANGLKKAHENKIIHRDIKPANIMITNEGNVKIVDFGLAKLSDHTVLTKTNTTMGTVAYMSPEQIEGEAVDHRSDIWSLGVVLYEMLTGELPFKGEYEQAIMYSIINNDPLPLNNFPEKELTNFQQIINKAIQKEINIRYQNIEEFLDDLQLLQEGSSRAIKPARLSKAKKLKTRKKIIYALILICGIVVTGILFKSLKDVGPRIPPKHKQITFSGNATMSAISPDGQFVAYLVGDQEKQRLLVEDLATNKSIEVLSNLRMARSLHWLRNSAEFLVHTESDRGEKVYQISRFGGTPKVINARMSYYNTVSPDEKYFAKANANWGAIQLHDLESGIYIDHIKILGNFNWLAGFKWSPRLNRILILTAGNENYTIWTINIDGTVQKKIVEEKTEIYSANWSAAGDAIYYLRKAGRLSELVRVDVSPETGEKHDEPQLLITGIETGRYFSISGDNSELFYTRKNTNTNLFYKNLQNSEKPKQLTHGTYINFSPKFSPDDQKIAFSRAKQEYADIFVMDFPNGEPKQVSFLDRYNSNPVWNADGSEIAFGSGSKDGSGIWKISLAGGNLKKLNNTNIDIDRLELTWAPAENIYYLKPGNRNFESVNGNYRRRLLPNEELGWVFNAKFSNSGSKVAFHRTMQWNNSENTGLWVQSLDDSTQNFISGIRITPIVWSKDDKSVYALATDSVKKILKINIDTKESEMIYKLPVEEIDGITMTKDGKHVVFAAVEQNSDIWSMENFDKENEIKEKVDFLIPVEYKQMHILKEGMAFYNEKKYKKAEQKFREGLELNPKYLRLISMLSITLLRQNKDEENKKLLIESYELNPDDAGIILTVGQAMGRLKQHKEAEEIFSKGLEYFPNDEDFRNGLGWALHNQQKYNQAIKYFKQSIKDYPGNKPAFNGLRWSYFYLKEYWKSEEYAKKHLSIESRQKIKASINMLLGIIKLIENNIDESNEYLSKAYSQDSSNVSIQKHYAYLLAKQKKYDEALKFAQYAFDQDTSFETYNALAWINVAGTFNLDLGIAYAQKALESKPEKWNKRINDYPYLAIPERTIGLAFHKKGDYKKAVEYLEKASSFMPERKTIKYELEKAKLELRESKNAEIQ